MGTLPTWYLSTSDPRVRLQKTPVEAIEAKPEWSLTVREEQVFQKWIGTGTSFTEAAAIALSRLSPGKQEEALRLAFDPDGGHGYTLGRIHINSCDFSLGNWDYVDPGDAQLTSFSLQRDEELLFPLVRRAESILGSPIRLVASPWSPPDWMKTNASMLNGGQLIPTYSGVWAKYLVRYIQEATERGLSIWGLTVQNEPQAVQVWESCIYSGEEQRDFIRDHLGPALEKADLRHINLMVWDHNKDLLNEFCAPILEDPEAAKFVWGAAYHWYSGDDFAELDRFHKTHPDKSLLFSEGCMEGGVKLGSWQPARRYIHDIIGDLENWTRGWIDWNVALDETGGPNHVGNLCDAPLILDGTTDTIHVQSSYHALGHIARFLPEGSVRIGYALSGECPVEWTVFRQPSGAIVAVGYNPTESPESLRFSVREATTTCTLPPDSISTFIWES